ncbi:MAG: minichromosome maintenance protein MCM [Euryarchaeota archaeon]|nr:minichromosome maintenance protein MCM [Euryarchaeota archaeon]
MSQEELVAQWENFFRDYYKDRIEEAALDWPDTRSLVVDYKDIDLRDITLAEYVLEHPTAAFYTAEIALRMIDVPVEPKPRLKFRIQGLPETATVDIRDLRSAHLNKMVAVKGLVKKVTEVRPKLEDAAFRCTLCGCIFRMPQEDYILEEPEVCPEDQAGCGRSGRFKVVSESSGFVDHQKLEIQESPEGLRGGDQPQRFTIHVEDDLVGTITPGDRCTINIVMRTQGRRQGMLKLTEFAKVGEAVSVEQEHQDYDEVVITPEDEDEILALSQDPLIYDKMRGSFAPTIWGMKEVKDALILALFGGVGKEYPDGSRSRGDTHVLMVGDPGVAKSQLLRYVSKLAPRSIYTSGKSASAAGLTAAAVRDEFGEGQWTLEAGALVLADLGIACIDELDKMSKQDQSSMHQAMEQQEISVAKAGIQATLKSRCSVIGAANPKLGRFDPYQSISDQIDMPPALLSRFDLIFSLKDEPSREFDTKLASHILRTHRAGEVHTHRKHRPDGKYTIEDENALFDKIVPTLDAGFLRKYVAYAKRNIFPVLDEDAAKLIEEFYVDLRNSQKEGIAFTARQLEGFVRLAEASARVRLSEIATLDDAKRAITIVDHYLRSVGMDPESGTFDIDMIATGTSHSQRDRMQAIINIIKDLCNENERGTAPRDELLERAEMHNISKEKAKAAVDQLKAKGQVYEPRSGQYRLTT